MTGERPRGGLHRRDQTSLWAELCLLTSYGVKSESVSCPVVSGSWRLCAALQAPLSVGLSRQEGWSGLPFPVAHTQTHFQRMEAGSRSPGASVLESRAARWGRGWGGVGG